MADFSPTRTHATWKPRVTGEHIPFYRCSECGNVFVGLDGNVDIAMRSDGERSLIAELPYAHVDFKPECHGKPMEKLEVLPSWDLEDKIKLDYTIMGGMNNNCIQVTWSVKDPECKPRWFALKTFTGLQMKYVTEKKWSPIVFALADEDAFAYCDKDPCVECTFRCKRGQEIYCYVEKLGLLYLPLDRMIASGSSASFEDLGIAEERGARAR